MTLLTLLGPQAAGGGTLQPALVGSTTVVYAPSVTAATALADLDVSGAQPFAAVPFAGSISPADVAGPIAPALIQSATQIYAVTLRVTLTPALYADPDTLHVPGASFAGVVGPAAYVDADTFHAPALRVTLAPALYADADAFYAPALSVAATVSVAAYADPDTFHGPTILGGQGPRAEVMWPQFVRRKQAARVEDDAEVEEAARAEGREARVLAPRVDDAITRALEPAAGGRPDEDAPPRPPVTMDELMAEALRLADAEIARSLKARLDAIRADDDRVLAAFLSRF